MSDKTEKAANALEHSQRLGDDWSASEETRLMWIALIQAQIAAAEAIEELVKLVRPLSVKALAKQAPTRGW